MTSKYFTTQLRLLSNNQASLLAQIHDLEKTAHQQLLHSSALEAPPPPWQRPCSTYTSLPSTSPPTHTAPPLPAPQPKCPTPSNHTFDVVINENTVIEDNDSLATNTVLADPIPHPASPPPCLNRFVHKKVYVHSARSDHQGNSFLVVRVTEKFLFCNTYPWAKNKEDIRLRPQSVNITPHTHPIYLTNSDSDSTQECHSPTPPANASLPATTRLL